MACGWCCVIFWASESPGGWWGRGCARAAATPLFRILLQQELSGRASGGGGGDDFTMASRWRLRVMRLVSRFCFISDWWRKGWSLMSSLEEETLGPFTGSVVDLFLLVINLSFYISWFVGSSEHSSCQWKLEVQAPVKVLRFRLFGSWDCTSQPFQLLASSSSHCFYATTPFLGTSSNSRELDLWALA